MSQISFVNSSENECFQTNPLDLLLINETKSNKAKDEEEYEFNETDSHITDLVKDYCDSDDLLSDSEGIKSLFADLQSKPKTRNSFFSLSTNESRNFSSNLFKISSLLKEDLKESVAKFKNKLFYNVSKKFFSQGTLNGEDTGKLKENRNYSKLIKLLKFYPEENINNVNIRSDKKTHSTFF